MTYKVKNWNEFQHYKDRAPPWIKLHRGLLDNIDYFNLSAESAKALALIWILASEKNGIIPEDGELAFRLRITKESVEAITSELSGAGFLCLTDDLGQAEQVATPAQQAGWGKRHISNKVKIEVWNRDSGRCCECGSDNNIEYDHVKPVSAGGGSEKDNIQLLCRPCNRKKRVRLGQRSKPDREGLGQRSLETETETEESQRKSREEEEEPAIPPDVMNAFSLWNSLAGELALPAAQKLNKDRISKLKGRLRDVGGIDGWNAMLQKIRGSPFLRGDSGKFTVTLDWVLGEKNFTKIMEGNYDPRRRKNGTTNAEDMNNGNDSESKWNRAGDALAAKYMEQARESSLVEGPKPSLLLSETILPNPERS